MTDRPFVSPVPPYGGPPQDRLPGDPPVEGVVINPGYPWGGSPGPAAGRGAAYGMGAGPSGAAHGPHGPFIGVPARPVRQKSLLLAALLAGLFPPLGMIYATVFGAVVMGFLLLPAVMLSGLHVWSAYWPLCVVWAVWAAHRKNQRRLAWAARGW